MVDALVTGATGFIGRHVVSRLLADGKTVRCLLRKTSSAENIPAAGVELHYGDVSDASSLATVAHDVKTVYHLAASGHVAAVREDAYRGFYEVNVRGTANLIEECLKENVRKFVHVSSTAAMGLIAGETADESTPPRPVTPYQRSKLESEQLVLRYWRERQFPAVVVRPSMVYGPDGSHSEFMKIVRLVEKGRFPMFGNGTKLTPGVYVADLVDGMVGAAERGRCGEVYILTGSDSFEFDSLLRLIAQHFGRARPGPRLPFWFGWCAAWGCELSSKVFGVTPWMTRQNLRSLVADRRFSIEKARRDFQYNPRMTLRDGVAETLKCALQQGVLKRT